MYNVLIIEDDNDINNMMYDAFTKEGCRCMQAFSGTEGLLLSRSADFDLIVLDLMLPGMTGEEVVANIKKERSTPIIVVSAKDSIDSKLQMLTTGADDYLTKPFEIRELLARAALQVRKNSASLAAERIVYRDLSLDRTSYTIKVKGADIPVTRQEFKILELLMLHPDKVYSKQEIYDYAWNDVYIGEDKTVNVHISNIRRKLREAADDDYIETVWGIGFKMRASS